MKAIFLAAMLGCLLTTGAVAKQFDLPDDNPAASVTLPGGWSPRETEHGVEATSPDGETYVAVETATAKGMKNLIDEDMQFLTDQGVTVDKASQTSQDANSGGMQVSFLSWKGKDKDGPTTITLGIFAVTDNLVLLMTAWSSPTGDKAHGGALTSIVQSIKKK